MGYKARVLNGQLKPAYNVQIAVENYYIVYGKVSNDQTDYYTLIPVLERHRKTFGEDCLKEATAGRSYCRGKNLLYLKEKRNTSYINMEKRRPSCFDSRF